MFNKPKDKYTEEEYLEMRRQIQKMNITKKEERQLFWYAVKTFLPWVLLLLVAMWAVLFLIIWLIS